MSNTKKIAKTIKTTESEALEQLTSMAAKIRYLLTAGYERADVARILNIKYQWVRNVQITPLKK